ncbi:MAG TPA: serine hydrolase domain-containing protein [Thermoanaerobaculia bacterium]|nr:serine hydrolase domain-containing protein [Thermoanaerobaculia bacterium]
MLSALSTANGRLPLRIGSSLLALAAAHAATASGQPRDPATLASELMSRDRLPSLSIAIGRGGQLVHAEAFGLADVESSVPASPKTVYRVGSVAKPITATAILRLAEQGRLDLDRPIETYCPAFPSKPGTVTARHLLAHLGGIRDYDYGRFDEEFLSRKRYPTLADALTVFAGDPLTAAPGAKHSYSSFGYVLLGCAVEGASGEPFGGHLERSVLGPAGMRQTRPDVPEQIVPHRAATYSRAPDGGWTNSPFVDLSDRVPAGGLLSTPSDLVAFGMALLDGSLISSETWSAMIEGRKTSAGERVAYGAGWRLGEEAGEVFHGGTSVGGSAYLYVRSATGTVVAFATNVDRWTEPRHELALALADWTESHRSETP